MDQLCPKCGYQILPTYNFCPNCGYRFKNPPLSTSLGKQIYLYLISILLPPLGLFPGIKYLLDKNPTAKIIGIILITLTLLSSVIYVKLSMDLVNSQVNQLNTQLNLIQGQGL